MTKKSLLVMAAGICAAGLTFNAGAVSMDLNYTEGGVTATGVIDVTGGHMASGTVTVSGAAKNGTFSWAMPPTVRGGDGTDIIFDNVVNLASTPMLTDGGLGFGIGPIDSTHFQYVLDIWGNGDGSYSLFEAGNIAGIDGAHVYNEYDGGKFSLTPSVPDGGNTIVLSACGLIGIGWMSKRVKKMKRAGSAASVA